MYCILRVLTTLLAIASVLGQSAAVSPERLEELKRDSLVYERIITEVIRQNFENPLALSAEPQVSYLHDYGVAVSFYLKVNRGTIRGFDGEMKNPVVKKARTREESLQVVRDLMLKAVADYGSTMKNLRPEEHLSICAHVEDRNELDLTRSRVTLVMTTTKKDIDLYMTRQIGLSEFRERLSLLEY